MAAIASHSTCERYLSNANDWWQLSIPAIMLWMCCCHVPSVGVMAMHGHGDVEKHHQRFKRVDLHCRFAAQLHEMSSWARLMRAVVPCSTRWALSSLSPIFHYSIGVFHTVQLYICRCFRLVNKAGSASALMLCCCEYVLHGGKKLEMPKEYSITTILCSIQSHH
jgi:hypothetical protein